MVSGQTPAHLEQPGSKTATHVPALKLVLLYAHCKLVCPGKHDKYHVSYA